MVASAKESSASSRKRMMTSLVVEVRVTKKKLVGAKEMIQVILTTIVETHWIAKRRISGTRGKLLKEARVVFRWIVLYQLIPYRQQKYSFNLSSLQTHRERQRKGERERQKEIVRRRERDRGRERDRERHRETQQLDSERDRDR